MINLQYPDDWKSTRLKNVSVINEKSLPATTDSDFTLNYLEISNVDNHGIISKDEIRELSFYEAPSRARRIVRNGDTIISSVRPNLQAVAYIKQALKHLIASTGFYVVSPNQKVFYEKYLYYLLISDGSRQHLESVAKGVGYPAVDDKDFGTFKFALSSLIEQKYITIYLDKACASIDKAIESKNKQLKTLEALRKSIIHKSVTQGLDDSVELKESGVEWFEKTPKTWNAYRIKDVAKLSPSFSEGNPSATDICTVIPMEAVSEEGKILNEHLQEFSSISGGLTNFEVGDVIFAKITPCMENGKGAFISSLPTKYALGSTEFHVLRPSKIVDGKFLYYYTYNYVFRRYAEMNMTGAAGQKRVSTNFLKYTKIFLPEIVTQHCIASYLDQKCFELTLLKENIQQQITTLEQYRKSLIHECVTGKRRITENDIKSMNE